MLLDYESSLKSICMKKKSLAAKMNKDTVTEKITWNPIDVSLREKILRTTLQSYSQDLQLANKLN